MTDSPVIILVQPQLGENIGFVARAMRNCGLTELRLVRPRQAWPNPKAVAAASGADEVLERAQLFESTAEAVADLEHLYATTARRRDMVKAVVTPRQAAGELRQRVAQGSPCGVLFGPERTGLDNDDVTRCDKIVEVPLNPEFSSLNLGQAVLLVAYEWFQTAAPAGEEILPLGESRPATRGEVENFFDHLEQALDASGFLRVLEKRPVMVRNLRNFFLRAQPTEKEIRSLHGVVKYLSGHRFRTKKDREGADI
ncbi:MAG: RNA methyltransferase [Acidobacteriota bacterium]